MINGTFICLHSCNNTLAPYYNTMEFANRLCLADCFRNGNPPFRDSYIAVNRNEIARRLLANGVLGKLFFVESNCAHNISYFLSKCACEQLRLTNDQKFLIVNFDQHEDYEGVGNEILCSNWGANICQTLKCDYLIVGRKTKKDAFMIKYVEGRDSQRKPSCKVSEIASIISAYDKIYVTVDMDVLSGTDTNVQRTNWPHGDIKINDLCEWLSKIPSDKIASADITGFPPKQMKTGTPVPNSKMGVLDSYIQDIETVAQAICNSMGIPY